MLPKPLTEDICSLRADVERLAFSVLWEITEDARVIGVRFTKSVIKYASPRLSHTCHYSGIAVVRHWAAFYAIDVSINRGWLSQIVSTAMHP